MAIAVDDIQRHYVTIAEARRMQGLRIVLGAFTLPGPWHEACKGIFHVKGLAYTPVRSSNANASDLQIGMDGSQSELVEWTAQSSAPVVVWNDERPRSLWNDQLYHRIRHAAALFHEGIGGAAGRGRGRPAATINRSSVRH